MDQSTKEIIFTRNLSDVPSDFQGLIGGNYRDKEYYITVHIASNVIRELDFKVKFRKYPKKFPFWGIITVKIQDQEAKSFFSFEKIETKSIEHIFSTPFKKDSILEGNVTIIYKITKIPTYICTLTNLGQTCYFNSSIQLLFHLAKFRKLLFSLHDLKKASVLFNLKKLFTGMSYSKSEISPEDLLNSFGWPPLARNIRHDAPELIQKLFECIYKKLDIKNQKKFDEIFTSQVISNSTHEIKTQYIMSISKALENFPLINRIENEMEDSKFHQLSEVLFFNFESIQYDQIPLHLDMSSVVSKDGPNKYTKYTLSGIVALISVKNFYPHYKCFVRNNSEEIWLYFNDSFGCHFAFKYDNAMRKYEMPLEQSIKNMVNNKETQICLLMYVASEVINDYFCFTPTDQIPSQNSNNGSNCSYGPSRRILISQLSDIIEYVEKGHTDFEKVGYSMEFELSTDMTTSSVYQYVAQELDVPLNSFFLRSEDTSTHAPYYNIFSNDPHKKLECFECDSIHLYYEELNEGKEKREKLKYQYIPFYFLLFRFNQGSFILNLDNNLLHSEPSKEKLYSTPVATFRKRELHRTSSNDSSTFKQMNTSMTQKQNKEKNSFQFLKCLVLNIKDKFSSVVPQLINEINKIDGRPNKHSKIHLYTAEYELTGQNKIGYREINVEDTIEETIPQIIRGIFIYVQCEDDFSEQSTKKTSNSIKSKFLFFKYMQKAFKQHLFPREIPNVFLMENFSIPVSFCKLNNPLEKSKTILFPFKSSYLNSLTKLKQFVCSVMDEEYPENGLIELFFGFKEGFPPLSTPLNDFNSILYKLELSMKQSNTKIIQFNYTFSSKEEEQDNEEEEELIDSDFDYTPNIFIHYQIFESFQKEKQISIRIYFSEDSISIKFTSQILVNKSSKVSDIAFNLDNIFELSKTDRNNLNRIRNNEIDFTDAYKIIRTSNGKIIGKLCLNSDLKSNIEVRFERIQKDSFEKDLYGFVPVSYGAVYNHTKFIGSFGTPFYLAVMKSDLNIDFFNNSPLYKRLKEIISMKDIMFDVCVVNNFGWIQNVRNNDVKTIIENNLGYSVCLRKLDASAFIDENALFSGELRILE